jgi:hypothetical protein
MTVRRIDEFTIIFERLLERQASVMELRPQAT